MENGFNAGTVVDKDSLEALTTILLSIMEAPGDQETKRHAMDKLERMARVEGLTIQNCVVSGDKTVSVVVSSDCETTVEESLRRIARRD